MEKFPKDEMGWVEKTEVKEYIARNYVPEEKYNKLRVEKEEIQEALNRFIDDFIKDIGDEELVKKAIKSGFSKNFILKYIYCNEWFYNQCYNDLVAEGEILPDNDDADEE